MKKEEIKKVHCFFEQSGTFKNEFIKLGIPAEDYDIQNNFGQTDHVIDLFAEIDKAYEQRAESREQRLWHYIRFNVKGRSYNCFLSVHIFLCYIANVILFRVCKLPNIYR